MVFGGVKVWSLSWVSEVNYILLKLYKLTLGEKEQIDCNAETFHSASTDLAAVKHLTPPPLSPPPCTHLIVDSTDLFRPITHLTLQGLYLLIRTCESKWLDGKDGACSVVVGGQEPNSWTELPVIAVSVGEDVNANSLGFFFLEAVGLYRELHMMVVRSCSLTWKM